MTAPALISSAEAADLLGVHRHSVNRYVAERKLTPVRKLGTNRNGIHLFDLADVLAFKDAQAAKREARASALRGAP